MILAVLLLTLLVFPILIIAFLAYISSGRPVFYWSDRIGKESLTFSMPKFRTMRTNTPEIATHMLDDPDVFLTPIGRLLRKTSLDEIPQFFNVIKGEMSLVGPRPERAYFVNQFRKNIPGYMLRHKVKSGLTGWAQINGLRGDTSIEKRIELE